MEQRPTTFRGKLTTLTHLCLILSHLSKDLPRDTHLNKYTNAIGVTFHFNGKIAY